jgi:hypothetical protein
LQFGEFRLPAGIGPFPVAVVIHGGCWTSASATLRNTAALADALREAGIATWNIEYRRLTIQEAGGRYVCGRGPSGRLRARSRKTVPAGSHPHCRRWTLGGSASRALARQPAAASRRKFTSWRIAPVAPWRGCARRPGRFERLLQLRA